MAGITQAFCRLTDIPAEHSTILLIQEKRFMQIHLKHSSQCIGIILISK